MPVTSPAPGASSSYMSHGRERGQLEERRARVDQPIDAFANGQLALLAMPLQTYFGPPPSRHARRALAQLGDELHASASRLVWNVGSSRS